MSEITIKEIAKLLDTKLEAFEKKVDKKFDAIDRKFDGIDKQFDAIDRKFDAIDKKLATLATKQELTAQTAELKAYTDHSQAELARMVAAGFKDISQRLDVSKRLEAYELKFQRIEKELAIKL